ncbi:MAG: hybrid sensor histidine kinase/response regulator, partial [Bacteroidota bacterium]
FNVKAANGDGVWSDEVTSLEVTIAPPWSRTTFAYVLYGLLFGLILWYYRRVQIRRLQLKYELESEQQEAERLKEMESFRSRLYTNITHEFRTPLTVILGTSERLEAAHPKLKQLSLIRRNGKNLLNLVNQMLDLAKVEHNKLQIDYQQGEVLQYLRYITESYYSVANVNNVLLKLESDKAEIWMDYDAEKLRQIISNLISNAIKYTPSGGRVVLKAKQENDQLQIEVRDSGQGIPADQLPYIFDRFYQVDNDISKSGGTGIGLALTRELVTLLEGSISVESQVGQGSAFTVLLPVRREAAVRDSAPVVEELSVGNTAPELVAAKGEQLQDAPTLLIVEDNLDVVEFLTLCLEPHYQLVFAYNGQAGIEKAFALSPDLILSDVMMPEKTGYDLTETLKQDERTSHIPIVLLTAKADLESRIKGLKHGADVYLPKPFHQEELLVNLDNLLKLRKK